MAFEKANIEMEGKQLRQRKEESNKMTHLLSKLCNLSCQRATPTTTNVKENSLGGNIKFPFENL